jgi:2-succinyl-6-hydroxy-2,4-cyclohexadiene-1-carboxylate synthase
VLGLHGFTGSGLDFAPLAELLGVPLVAPDLPGHGESDTPDDLARYAFPAVLDLLAALLEVTRPRAVLGYSLGGRLALSLAVERPELVPRLVLVGATAGLEAEGEREARRAADAELAARIERDGVAAFQRAWEEQPLIATQARIAEPHRGALRARRGRNRAIGLANTLRGLGTGVMPPLWGRLDGVDLPALLITGADDEKFGTIARRMATLLPGAEHRVIEGAGHCAHLEQPGRTAEILTPFLVAGPRS